MKHPELIVEELNTFESTVYDERELFDLLADNIEIMTD